MLVQLAGNDYVVGLHWSRIAGTSVKEEVQLVAEEIDANLGLIREVVVGDRVERQAGFTSKKSDLGKPSAAAVLADAVDQVLLIDAVGPDTVWVCVVVDHTVLAGSDILVGRDEAEDRVRGLLFGVLEDVGDLRIVAPSGLAQELNLKEAEEGSFAALTAHVTAGKNNRVRRLRGKSSSLLLMGGMVIASSALYYVWTSNQPSVPEPSLSVDFGTGLSKSSVSDVIQQQGPSQEELLSQARQEEITWLTEAFRATPTSQVMDAVIAAYANAPRQVAGFTLVGLSWSNEQADAVKLVWRRATEGRSTALRERLADARAVMIAADSMEATSVHGIELKPIAMDSFVDYLGGFSRPIEQLVDALSTHRYSWKADRHQFGDRPQAIVGILDGAVAQTRQLQLMALSLDVVGTSSARLEALSSLFDQDGKTFQIQQITLQVGAETPWQIKGVTYEAP